MSVRVTPLFVQEMKHYLRERGVPCERLLITETPMGGLILDVDGVKREFAEAAIMSGDPEDLFEFFLRGFK